jgi:hypothetical protein
MSDLDSIVTISTSIVDADGVTRATVAPALSRFLHFLDSSPFVSGQFSPNLNAAELWEYSLAQLVDGYAGVPGGITRLPNVSYAGRGHDLCITEGGHRVVATSEPSGGNGNESWFLIPPGAEGALSQAACPRIRCAQLFSGTTAATGGARSCIDMGGGNILLGSNGAWKMVTAAAWSMTDEQLAAIPHWSYNGNGSISGILTWDHHRVPGTQTVRFNGDNRFFDIDFSVPPGVINGTTVPGGDGLQRIALGSNIGQLGWYGFLAIDSLGDTWKVRGYEPDIACWTAATVAALPKLGNQAGANPPPDKTLSSPVFDALVAPETLMSCVDFDLHGNLWVASNSTNRYTTLNVVQSSHLWRFPAAAVQAGGEQMPDITITLPDWTQPWTLRIAPQFRMHAR